MSGLWDQRYAGERYFYGTEPNAFLQQRERPVLEGEGHTGVGAVVQLRAVKRQGAVRSRWRLRKISGP